MLQSETTFHPHPSTSPKEQVAVSRYMKKQVLPYNSKKENSEKINFPYDAKGLYLKVCRVIVGGMDRSSCLKGLVTMRPDRKPLEMGARFTSCGSNVLRTDPLVNSLCIN